ncbi:hypothetical protein SAMN06265784_105404 [Paraburkholderia susongensis]|uniref:Uncharacterized protein n=1 Tax=Paraburkholderia susongensis TaxID=1515439 RepID=A0A1X7LCB7_9BURK|nr:hypothetical protein SAMN06265784_105404 [Paraburkholderia susongensis]
MFRAHVSDFSQDCARLGSRVSDACQAGKKRAAIAGVERTFERTSLRNFPRARLRQSSVGSNRYRSTVARTRHRAHSLPARVYEHESRRHASREADAVSVSVDVGCLRKMGNAQRLCGSRRADAGRIRKSGVKIKPADSRPCCRACAQVSIPCCTRSLSLTRMHASRATNACALAGSTRRRSSRPACECVASQVEDRIREREPWGPGSWALCRHPRAVEDAYVLADHGHPVYRITTWTEPVRVPCFPFGIDCGMLLAGVWKFCRRSA